MSQNEQTTSLGSRQATKCQYDQATTLGGTPNDVSTASLASILEFVRMH